VYFGGNDSLLPHPSGRGQHVPLQEYIENMRKIGAHLKVKQHISPFLLPHESNPSPFKYFYIIPIFLPFNYYYHVCLTQILVIARAFQRRLASYFSLHLLLMRQTLPETGFRFNLTAIPF